MKALFQARGVKVICMYVRQFFNDWSNLDEIWHFIIGVYYLYSYIGYRWQAGDLVKASEIAGSDPIRERILGCKKNRVNTVIRVLVNICVML